MFSLPLTDRGQALRPCEHNVKPVSKLKTKMKILSEETAQGLELGIIAVAATIVVLVPVVLDPDVLLYAPGKAYDLPKFRVLMEFCAILLVAMLGLLAVRRKLLLGVPVLAPALAFLGVSALSTLFSEDPSYSLFGDRYNGLLSVGAGVLLFYALARCLSSPLRVRIFLTAGATTAVLISILGILQKYGLDPISGWANPPFTSVARPFSTPGNPLFLAAYLTLMIGAATALCFKSGSRGRRTPWLLALAVMGGCWIYTDARGGLLAVGIALPVVLWVARRKMGTVRPLAAPLAALVVGMVLAIAAAMFLGSTTSLSHSTTGFDLNAQVRLSMWRDTASMILHHPLLGSGPDNFSKPFASYMSEDLKAAISTNGEYRVDRAHNELLQVGATTGLLGLAAYLWIFISYFRNAYRRAGWPLIALSGAVLAYFLQLQTVFSTIDTGVAFWSILGTSVALMRIHDQEQLEGGEQERGEGPNPKTPRQATIGSVRGALISGVPKKRGLYYELGVVVVVFGVLAAIAIPISLEQRERVAQIERLALMGDVTQTVSTYERAKEQSGTYPKAGAYTASNPLEADGTKIPTNHNVRIVTTTTPAGGFAVEGESTTLSGTFRYGYDSSTGYTTPP